MFTGQSVLNLLGEFSGLRRHQDAVYADLTVFESSKGRDMLFDLAENHPHAAGFSINARGKFEEEPDKQGREIVNEIVAIRSCDFVGEPATTYGVFEQELPDSSFAYVNHDADVPVRLLPFKDADGKIDLSQLRKAIDRINKMKEVPDEIKESIWNRLKDELETAEAVEAYPDEPYAVGRTPKLIEGMPTLAQEIYINEFNKSYAESQDDRISRDSAWEELTQNYKQTASKTWMQVKGGETMEKIVKFFEEHVRKWSTLTEEGKEEAALEYMHGLLETSDYVGKKEQENKDLGAKVTELNAKVEEVSSQLAEAQAKVDAYETKEAEAKAKETRIELIAKITKEQELDDEAMSETFKNILMVVAEDKIEDLVKDRKALLATGTTGVQNSGHEAPTGEGEGAGAEDEDKKKIFFSELEENL
jgi:hypothetical protein